jgi:hypothetical protein
MLVIAALLSDPETIEPLRAAIITELGAADVTLPLHPYTHTRYYHAEMGDRIVRCFLALRRLVDPATLAGIKTTTNHIERTLAVDGRRRANLDPGLLSRSSFILATTKTAPHRVPLAQGIYGEITLIYERGEFRPVEWTYPDWSSRPYREHLGTLRARYVGRLRRSSGRA